MTFKTPENFRDPRYSCEESGCNGVFWVDSNKLSVSPMLVIISDGDGWEHVSVSTRRMHNNKYVLPTWNDMCFIKALFWDDTDTVVQFHLKKTEYVNIHPGVLHLWRKAEENPELPPKQCV